MTSTQRALLVGAIIALLTGGVSHAADYSGSLSTDDGGLIGTDGWMSGATLSWDITTEDGMLYEYCYSLTVPYRAPSHFIFSATPGEPAFQEGWPDLMEFIGDWKDPANPYLTLDPLDDEVEIGTFYGSGNDKPNPYMPGDIFGVKVNIVDGEALDLEWCFTAYRMPVPGDFYSVDGWDNATGAYAALWNASFGDPDGAHKVMVPNGRTPELPPAALALLGMLPLAWTRVRRRKT